MHLNIGLAAALQFARLDINFLDCPCTCFSS